MFFCNNFSNKVLFGTDYPWSYCGYLESNIDKELSNIYGENQRKCIGKKLITECFDLLKNMEYKNIIVRCLKGNPSENFYTALGGKIIDSEAGNVGGLKIIENIYKFSL